MLELNRLYNMDCMQGMREFPDKFFELAIVDPPYGINITHKLIGANKKTRIGGFAIGKVYQAKSFDKKQWDTAAPTPEYFAELFRVSKNQIIFGGNYFALRATPCFIVWDKKKRGLDQADCELAWTSFNKPCRVIDYRWNGFMQGDMTGGKKAKEEKIHPTQKPVALYRWLLKHYAKAGDKILDTHVGSASSLIACYDEGFYYCGFELDADYFRDAQERIENAKRQARMFDPAIVRAENLQLAI